MNAATNAEYRKLALDSSNDMIDHDADRGLGRYPKAAWHMLQAGITRVRMGQMMFDAQEFVWAAEDWLSASACFYLATDLDRMRATFDRVRKLDQEGKIPPERRDIHAAIKEREEQIKTLYQRLTDFHAEYAHLFGQAQAASHERLKFVRKHVREFPGFAPLHFTIYQQARDLGEAPLAAEHLRWAAEFAPDDPEYVGRYGYQLIAGGRSEQAANLAHDFLAKHPLETSIRVMLAQALASESGGHTPDRNASIEILRGILTDESASANVRLAAVTLSGALRRDMGEEAEAQKLLVLFDQLAPAIIEPANDTRIAALREVFTKPMANGTGSNPKGEHPPLVERLQRVLFPFNEIKSVAA
ncbi:tetratricopeptide repeat protein [Frigoriglobus tundricola]|uniref:Uncharacterized protein n=1 Tax=Frigoriglobus tundricola TaxID=2774151 RepID=A0A6M5YRY3_9BACT|nr:hypothetical protein [Frigoriglobus tundricola]QJW96200.1 hypothetical protein FTUN_3757 [Frigoriglobus tundricola]